MSLEPNADSASPLPSRPPEEGPTPDLVEQSSLLRQLFFERYFRAALLLLVLVFTGAALLLPRMVRSTPKDFLPVIHIRALDKLQAWSLARTARDRAAAGQLDAAMLAWQAAVANDPGDPALSRGLVSTLRAQPIPPRKYLALGANHALWLLRLTDTNRADLDLAAQLFSLYGLDEFVASLLRPVETNLTPSQAGEYLKAQFNLNFMEAFGTNWTRYSNSLAGNPELGLYRAAWEAGWGPPGTLRSGAATLAAATTNRDTAALAHRLALAVAYSRADIAAYEKSLAELTDTHADRVSDHLGHWRLLLNAGQRSRAADLARAYSNPPDTPNDAMAMADIFLEVGLPDYAASFLEKQLPTFNFRPDLWQRLGDIYARLGRWDDLRALAVNVRASERIRPDLNGYAWFLEGISALKLGRTDAANQAFAQAVSFPPKDPLLTYRMATGLNQYGYPDQATRLLQTLEQDFGGLSAYWFQVVSSAYLAQQFDIMHAAAQRGYELATNNPIFINNYAAALLIQRTNSPLAIQLTMQRLSTAPHDPGAHLNHALALLQNGRLEDAEAELKLLDPEQLNSYYNTVLQLGFFELNFRRGNRAAALQAYERIEPRFLMPPQARWVEETHRTLVKAG